jgi:hypothetical protein
VSVLASSQSGDTVVFDLPLPATITVSLPIVIDRSLNIQGPGADLLTISVSVPGAVLTPGVQVREGHQLMMSGVQLTGTTDPLVDLQPYWNPSIMSLPGRLVLIDAVVKPAVRVSCVTGPYGHLTMVRSAMIGCAAGVTLWGIVTLHQSTIEANLGVVTRLSTLSSQSIVNLTQSTISALTSAMQVMSATVSIDSSTIVHGDKGLWPLDESTFTLHNSVVSGQGGHVAGPGQFVSVGHNYFSDTSFGASRLQLSDRVHAEMHLSEFGNHGGATPTYVPLSESPLIDAGVCVTTNDTPLTTDQRGQPRPRGITCDVGAVEGEPSTTSKAIAALHEAVALVATQTSLDHVQQRLSTLENTRLDAAISSRASQVSVDHLRDALEGFGVGGLGGLRDAVLSRASQDSVVSLGDQVLDLKTGGGGPVTMRVQIELHLASGARLSALYLPEAEGGYLEAVRAVVDDVIARHQALGLPRARLARAVAAFNRGDEAAAAGNYRRAFDGYAEAYQLVVR